MMQDFLLKLFACSVSMSVLTLAYIAVTPLLAKRYSAKSLYYTWLIIVVGLIVPFRPHFESAAVEIAVPSITLTVAPGAMPQIGQGAPNAAYNNTPLPEAAQSLSIWQLVFILWLTGALAAAVWHIVSHARAVGVTKRWSEAVLSGPAFDALQSLKEELGIAKPVGLFRCACIGSPMAIGVKHTRILLPKIDFTADELRYILGHELIHLKRHDLIFKALTLAATTLHWFNPLAHMMGKAIALMCEISCDAEVMNNTEADARRRYSETIIGVINPKTRFRAALSTSFYSGKKGMKKRISSIMDIEKRRTGLALVLAALLVTMGTGFAFGAAPASEASYNAPVFDSDAIWDILKQPLGEGIHVQHEPMPGQLDEAQAFSAARGAAERLVVHLTAGEAEFDVETMPVQAILYQPRPYGMENIPAEAKYSLWYVTLAEPGELTTVNAYIHAQTGMVLTTEIRYLSVEPGLKLNARRMLSGFMADLGYEGIAYDTGGDMTAGELQLDSVSSEELIAGGRLGAVSGITRMLLQREGESGKIVRIGITATVLSLPSEGEEK